MAQQWGAPDWFAIIDAAAPPEMPEDCAAVIDAAILALGPTNRITLGWGLDICLAAGVGHPNVNSLRDYFDSCCLLARASSTYAERWRIRFEHEILEPSFAGFGK
ncbi:hypothetical protein N9164_12580 [Draconibacterium sp.]|nr:hypothetical protein [Draconibacterium sp.]